MNSTAQIQAGLSPAVKRGVIRWIIRETTGVIMSALILFLCADRWGWLAAIADRMRELIAQDRSAVFACSALKQKYRDQLSIDPAVHFVYLKGSYDLIWSRMQQRAGHYMKANMLASQFEALEEPRDALTLDVAAPVGALVDQIVRGLRPPIGPQTAAI